MHEEQERGITIGHGPDETLTGQCRTLSRRETDAEFLRQLESVGADISGNAGWSSSAKPVTTRKSPKVRNKRKAQRKARRANRERS